MPKYECAKCGLMWESRVPKPRACPRCKRYEYDNTEGELDPSEEGDASDSEIEDIID